MRTVGLTCLALVIFGASVTAQDSPGDQVDQKYGFRDVRLDAPISAITRLKEVDQGEYKTAAVRAFVREKENLALFGTKLSSITYFFFQDRLFKIELAWGAQRGSDASAILDGFRTAFGVDFELYDLPLGTKATRVVATGKMASFLAFCGTRAYTQDHPEWAPPYCRGYVEKLGVQPMIDLEIAKDAEAARKKAAAQF